MKTLKRFLRRMSAILVVLAMVSVHGQSQPPTPKAIPKPADKLKSKQPLVRIPDLVVTQFGTGPWYESGAAQCSLAMCVKNSGWAVAGTFKVHVKTTEPGENYIPFIVGPFADFPFSGGDLMIGEECWFQGVLEFPASYRGRSVTIEGYADSRAREPEVPTYGRVKELLETNNSSQRITLLIPQ